MEFRLVLAVAFCIILAPLDRHSMPELPDITAYVTAMDRMLRHQYIRSVLIKSPFVMRTVGLDVEKLADRRLMRVFRIGKQIVWEVETDKYLIFHLMIAGRFHWKKAKAAPRGKHDLLSIAFDFGTLLMTEASTKKRASLHCVAGAARLSEFDRGGLEPLQATAEEFAQALKSCKGTLKRVLTDPAVFSGIGNAYSDEILCVAELSPFQRAAQMDAQQIGRLHEACQTVLRQWTDRLVSESNNGFPEKVTAFRPDMLVHGRYRKPCGRCGTTVQRVVYSEREFHYCPRCQTGGRIHADRSLSRLLKDEWPKRMEEE